MPGPAGRYLERRRGRHLPRWCLPDVDPCFSAQTAAASVGASQCAPRRSPGPHPPSSAAPDLITHSSTKQMCVTVGDQDRRELEQLGCAG